MSKKPRSKKQMSLPRQQSLMRLLLVVIGILIVCALIGVRSYRNKSQGQEAVNQKLGTLHIDSFKAQDEMKNILAKYSGKQASELNMELELDKSCNASGYGYGNFGIHKLVCSATNRKYLPVTSLDTSRQKQMYDDTEQAYKKLGYSVESTPNPDGERVLIIARSDLCVVELGYQSPMDFLSGYSEEEMAAYKNSDSIMHVVECSQAVLENQNGSFQQSCSKLYADIVPDTFKCD